MAYDRHGHQDTFRLADKKAPGLVIRIRRPGLDAKLLIEEAMPVLRRHSGGPLGIPELKAIKKTARAFAESVQDWTLELDGKPAPVTARTLGRYEPEFVLALVLSWLEAIKRPTPKLKTAPAPTPPADGVDAETAAWLAELPMQMTKPVPEEVALSA